MQTWQIVCLAAAGVVMLVSYWPQLRGFLGGDGKDADGAKDGPSPFPGSPATIDEVATYLGTAPDAFKWVSLHSRWTLVQALCERIKRLEGKQ